MATPVERLADRLDDLLPQTQCRRCGFDGCRPYALAMAEGLSGPNRCPPGGPGTLQALADALGVEPPAGLDAETGAFGAPTVVVIDESVCIGCAKCLPACPVDAIVGARRYMHTVLAAECSGCDLCIPACPVDCITVQPAADEPLSDAAIAARAVTLRRRIAARAAREARTRAETARRLAAPPADVAGAP